MTEDKHLWRLRMDKRLLAEYILIIIIIIIIMMIIIIIITIIIIILLCTENQCLHIFLCLKYFCPSPFFPVDPFHVVNSLLTHFSYYFLHPPFSRSFLSK